MRIKKGCEKGQRHIYSNKGMISLVDPCHFTSNLFEIYSLDGNLFEDIERFVKEDEAIKRCKELLD